MKQYFVIYFYPRQCRFSIHPINEAISRDQQTPTMVEKSEFASLGAGDSLGDL